MALTIPDITSLVPALSGLDSALLQKYLDIVTSEADLALNNIFADPLPVVLETNCQNYDTKNIHGSDFISISAWQESGLTIKRTDRDNQNLATLTESPLVLGQDYIYWYGWRGNKIPGKTLPITAIKLLNCSLGRHEILRVYGTYGWQAGYPSDVQVALANVVGNLASYASNPGNLYTSGANRIKDLSTEIEYSDSMTENLRNQARNFLNDPAFQQILDKYLYPLQQTVTVL